MQFQSKTDEQIQRESLIPPGEYDFQIAKAEDKKSKTSGADMIAMELSVYVGDKERVCRDWLMESMAFKLRHFCYSVGLGAKYEAGTFTAADCEGRGGKVKIIVKDSPEYGPQNSVKDYIVPDANASKDVQAPTPVKMKQEAEDPSIPF